MTWAMLESTLTSTWWGIVLLGAFGSALAAGALRLGSSMLRKYYDSTTDYRERRRAGIRELWAENALMEFNGYIAVLSANTVIASVVSMVFVLIYFGVENRTTKALLLGVIVFVSFTAIDNMYRIVEAVRVVREARHGRIESRQTEEKPAGSAIPGSEGHCNED